MSKTPASDTSAQEIEIDFFRIEDAPGIARLFRQVYGEGYPIRTYYLPDQLIQENASGNIISSVARTSTGEVVAHDALVLMDSATHLYENVAGVVLPAFRGRGIFARLFKQSIFEASQRFGVEGIVGEAVCNHSQLQKLCFQLGCKELGLEVDLMPATVYAMEPGVLSRVSLLLEVCMHKPRSRTVHMPLIYRHELEYLYADLEVERTFVYSRNDLPAEGCSLGGMNLFDLAQFARITIDCIGLDFDSFITHLENEAREKGTQIFHVWLPLTSPFAPAATDILREHGYFLGGIQPCLPNSDGLLMQKVTQEPNWESIVLYSERAKKIGEMIRRDWKRVANG